MVLKSPSIPSVLVETSFITDPNEEKLLGTTAFRQKIATAIANGIISYFHWFDNSESPFEETLMKPDAAQVKNFSAPAPGQPLSAAERRGWRAVY